MARPRSAGYDEQRAQLLRAAASLFAQRGYTASTMLGVAQAGGVSKATLYHYFADKQQLLADITLGHVAQLEALVARALEQPAGPVERLRRLILDFMQAYGGAADAHRVLTEDVKFLDDATRKAVEDGQRRVVQAFADAVAAVRPDLQGPWHKPLAMLLFGMINWTFTWLRPAGALDHAALAPVVVELFVGGLVVLTPPAQPRPSAGDRTG